MNARDTDNIAPEAPSTVANLAGRIVVGALGAAFAGAPASWALIYGTAAAASLLAVVVLTVTAIDRWWKPWTSPRD